MKSILEKIEKEKIKPRSKLYFFVKNMVSWLFTLAGLFIAGTFSAGIIVYLSNRSIVPGAFFAIVIFVLLVFLGLMLYTSYLLFMRVKRSHRARLRHVLLLGLLSVFILGFFVAHSRIYSRIDQAVKNRSLGVSLQERIEKAWSHPERNGQLAVEVLHIDDDGYVYGEGFNKSLHMIDPLLLSDTERDLFVSHLRIHMVGFKEDGIFYPDHVQPWRFRYQQDEYHPDYNLPVHKGNIDFGSL